MIIAFIVIGIIFNIIKRFPSYTLSITIGFIILYHLTRPHVKEFFGR